MALLNQAIQDKKYDTRILERNQVRGIVNSQDAEKALKELPDDSVAGEWRNIDQIDDLLKQRGNRS